MNVDFKDDDFNKENLSSIVTTDNDFKSFIVNYVGEYLENETGEVTVENIVEVMSAEFPEFLLAVAEENWVRGYHQALFDVEKGQEMLVDDNKEIYKK